MSFEEDVFFGEGPGVLVDIRIQMVVPPRLGGGKPLSNLFGCSLGVGVDFFHFIGDDGPFLEAVQVN